MHTISRQKHIIIIVLLLATALLLTPAVSQAQGPKPGDKVILGRSFTLASGESLDGDLVVFGGNVIVQQDATGNGDVAAIGGTASIDGVVNGDIVAMAGVIELGPHAIITGDNSICARHAINVKITAPLPSQRYTTGEGSKLIAKYTPIPHAKHTGAQGNICPLCR